MARGYGERVPTMVRRKGIRTLQNLLAAGVDEREALEQIVTTFNISAKSATAWLKIAFSDLAKEAVAPRGELLGLALKRRRLAMARAARENDWKTYLAAADSEAKLLGLNAPILSEQHVVVTKVQDMSRAVVEVVRDFFTDLGDRARFVDALRKRLNAQLAQSAQKPSLVIDAESEEVAQIGSGSDEPVEASDARLDPPAVDVAPTAAPAPGAPPPA